MIHDPIDTYVGSRIRAARAAKNMSQTKLADGLHLTFQQIQKYERGTNRISASKLYHAANVLGVTVSYFYEGLDAPDGVVDPTLASSMAETNGLLTEPGVLRLAKVYSKMTTPQRRAVMSVARSMVPA
jgi:transcriptional regulator with XRE-family HTH domain